MKLQNSLSRAFDGAEFHCRTNARAVPFVMSALG